MSCTWTAHIRLKHASHTPHQLPTYTLQEHLTKTARIPPAVRGQPTDTTRELHGCSMDALRKPHRLFLDSLRGPDGLPVLAQRTAAPWILRGRAVTAPQTPHGHLTGCP